MPGLFLGQLPPSQCKFTFKIIPTSREELWNSSRHHTLRAHKGCARYHTFLRTLYPTSGRAPFYTISNQSCSARWSHIVCNTSQLNLASGLLLSVHQFSLKIYPSSNLLPTLSERAKADWDIIWQKLTGTYSSWSARPKTLYTYAFNFNLIPEEGLFFSCGTKAYITLSPGWTGLCSLAFIAPMADYALGTSNMPRFKTITS